MNDSKIKVPGWFWAIAIIALLWNLMGVGTFVMHVSMSEEALRAFPQAEQDLYNSFPAWTIIAWAIAVFAGAIGAIGLLIKKSWANFPFIISLIALVPQMLYNIFFTKSKEVYGPGADVMPVLVIVLGVFFLWFSYYAAKKGWLK